MEINQKINVELQKQGNQTKVSKQGENLAKQIMLFADKNSLFTTDDPSFKEKLNKIEKFSTQDLIKFIRAFDKEESVIELICDEVGSTNSSRQEACLKILSALTNKAKELGVDTNDFEQQFIKELDYQFNSFGLVNTDKLDKIVNALTQSIENRQSFTPEDIQTIQNTTPEEGVEQSNEVLENRLEKTYAAFGERVGEDGEMTTKDKNGKLYNGQMQRDGIAADIADGVSRIWGSENTAAKVRRDLKIANNQLQQLQEAKAQGTEAYKAKFKEIFGVEYDFTNIAAYQKAEKEYLEAKAHYDQETTFNRANRQLLRNAPLEEEVTYYRPDPNVSVSTKIVTATKEQVYKREFDNLANFIGPNGAEILNQALQEKGISNAPIENKYELLKEIAQGLSKQLHANTIEATGGREFSELQSMYDNSYKAAYGVDNDIMKRVTDYNMSQEMGAGVVKAGATIAASLGAAFSGIGLVGVAAITAGATVGAEVIDRGTSGKALDALREQGLGEYLETSLKDVDWEATFKQAVMSGGAVLIGGGAANGVTAIMKGSSTTAQFAAMLGTDVVTDAVLEYATTQEITWQGMVFTVLLSTIGNAAQIKQMKADHPFKAQIEEKLYDISLNIAKKRNVTQIEEKLSDINLKKTLTNDPSKLAKLDAQAKVYDEALVLKGLKAMKKDGIDYPKVNNLSIGYSYTSDKVAYRDMARSYARFKNSGLDLKTYFSQNYDKHSTVYNIACNLKVRKPEKFAIKVFKETPLAKKHPKIAEKLTSRYKATRIYSFDRDDIIRTAYLDYNYNLDRIMNYLKVYDSSPLKAIPELLLDDTVADNIKGQGISFKQAPGQKDYSATRIEWGETVGETIALNKKNGVNLELVKGNDGEYFLGIKDIWSDGYHRVDRNSVVMHYGNYEPTPKNGVEANPEWVKANANPDGTVKDCAVVANDIGAKILENSYVTADGQKIDFATMKPGTKVHKDPNAIVNAVAYDSPKTLHTLEGDITTDITMGDVDGNVYNNFKALKKQITKGQLVVNDADPYSARFIELIKNGKDDEAIALLKDITKQGG